MVSYGFAKPPTEGLSKSEVLRRYGEPKEKIEMSHLKKEVWKYPRRDVVFYEGKVQIPETAKPSMLHKRSVVPKNKITPDRSGVSLGEVLKSLPKEDDKKPGQASIPAGEASSIVQID